MLGKRTSVGIFLICLFSTLSVVSFGQKAGKIWVSGTHLFVNVPEQGVMIVDNTNPEEPAQIGYIPIPGNVDLAVVGNIMLANYYDDLISINWEAYLSDPSTGPSTIIEDVFPNYDNGQKRPMGMIDSRVGIASSVGGSMSCFALDDGDNPSYLYAITNSRINCFDIQNAESPRLVSSPVSVDDEIETVFVQEDRLYIGAQAGMYIYSLENPEEPEYMSCYKHLRSCDPVVVEDGFAYITVRDGKECGRTKNELHIVDIREVSRPQQVAVVNMDHPHGLGVDRGKVFICDGASGLRVLEANNPGNIQEISRDGNIGRAYDVIPQTSMRQLVVVAGDNIHQYRYSSAGNLTKLSEFSIDY